MTIKDQLQSWRKPEELTMREWYKQLSVYLAEFKTDNADMKASVEALRALTKYRMAYYNLIDEALEEAGF